MEKVKMREAYDKHIELFKDDHCTYHQFWQRFKKIWEDAIKMPKVLENNIGSLPRHIAQAGVDISPVTVNSRMKAGMTLEDAINTPLKRKADVGEKIKKAIKLLERLGYLVTKK